jgi:cytochrome c peroxidase
MIVAHALLLAPVATATSLGTPNMKKIDYPGDEPPSQDLVHLGKVLFFDPRLSYNDSMSCATCHIPALAFSDGRSIGIGAQGSKLVRNAPHLINLAWATVLQWDGKQSQLDVQALAALKNPLVMNLPLDKAVEKLKAVSYYSDQFQKLFPKDGVTSENLGKALGAFERSLISTNSPFDKYMGGDKNALSPQAIRGLELFQGKAKCSSCHDGANFTDESYHNIGVKSDDIGRGAIVKEPNMQKAFRTPGLRNISLTAPYMHDGSIKTLEDVVQFYNEGGTNRDGIDPLIKPLNLTPAEAFDLLSFLVALTDPIAMDPPEVPK